MPEKVVIESKGRRSLVRPPQIPRQEQRGPPSARDGMLRSARRCRSRHLAAAATALILFGGASFFYGELTLRFVDSERQPRSHSIKGDRVSIWNPYDSKGETALCRGQFASQSSPHSRDGFPMAVVRDAAVDDRSASAREYAERFAKRGNAFLRIVLYVTAHLSVSLSKARANVSSSGPSILMPSGNASLPSGADFLRDMGVNVAVDYVLHVNPFVVKPGPYTPGKKTFYGQDVSEWQIVVSLTPAMPPAGEGNQFPSSAFYESLVQRMQSGAFLSVPMELQPFDKDTAGRILFSPRMSLACALGWHTSAPLDLLRGPRPACGDRSAGAVALAGSALHGSKAQHPRSIREVAHFAARSLLGPVAFDAVAIPVIGRTSHSAAEAECSGEGAACVRQALQENQEKLDLVAEVVENELATLGVPASMFPRVILLPMCNLGTHHSGSEVGNPCSTSFWANQYMALYLLYNVVGSSFQWSATYDIDEYLSPKGGKNVLSSALRMHRAVDLFSSLDRRGYHAMKFIWLNFHVADVNTTHSLTKELMQTQRAPKLVDPSGRRQDCYSWPTGQGLNGKTALHCENGMGFTIHAAVQLMSGRSMTETTRRTNILSRNMRLWHPRLGGSLSPCDYEPRHS